MDLTNEVNTARLVRAMATVPEICMHNVKLGPGCFCPHCPTASFAPAHEPSQLQKYTQEALAKADDSLPDPDPLF